MTCGHRAPALDSGRETRWIRFLTSFGGRRPGKGARREYVRRALELTVRERLEALDEMGKLARRFEELRAQGKFRSPKDSGVA
jgi:hypothetical protein